MKRAVIMADGKGTRWHRYLGIPKHFAPVNGEPLIVRTVRLLNERVPQTEVIVTSHDPRYDIPGSTRHVPQHNVCEIDRFTRELIIDDMCFFYGDAYYTEASMDTILQTPASPLLFFGNTKTIAAIKIRDADPFREHVELVRSHSADRQNRHGAGWQVYRSWTGQDEEADLDYSKSFVFLDEETRDFNSPEEYTGRKRV